MIIDSTLPIRGILQIRQKIQDVRFFYEKKWFRLAAIIMMLTNARVK